MMKPRTKRAEDHDEAMYDEAVEESFPASDAPAAGGATRIEDDAKDKDKDKGQHEDQHKHKDGKHKDARRNVPHASSDDMDEPTGGDQPGGAGDH